MDSTFLVVRSLAEAEVPLIEDHINLDWAASGKHAERFRRQASGDAVYLVAWLENLPVGHAFIKWSGANTEPMLSRLHECPVIEDLFVVPDQRSKGIGTSILGHAEALASQDAYKHIGLGVEVRNTRARRLYERIGYRDAGLGKYRTTWYYRDREGRKWRATEICNFFLKALR